MLRFENFVPTNKRNEDVDFYKGLLMWGVIYGHMLAAINRTFDMGSSFLYAFLTIFDMPFFMLLSGFFLKKSLSKKTPFELLRSRTTMLFVPIVIWTLIAGGWTIGRYYFLWAVYVSSIICICTRIFSSLFSKRLGKTVEYLVYVLFIAFTYFYSVPWNMFYLFPFFIVGYSLNNVSFKIKNLKAALFLFVVGLCFWTSEYRPWIMGWNAWTENPFAIVIYVYRFLLALLGVFVMANAFSYLKNTIGGGKIILLGRETLAIYILQAFVVERFFSNGLYRLVKGDFVLAQYEQNLLGYVICPIISFLVICLLYKIILLVKHCKYTKWLFGF